MLRATLPKDIAEGGWSVRLSAFRHTGLFPRSARSASECVMGNIDWTTVRGFGREWQSFDQARLPDSEARARANEYFRLVAFSGEGFDLGCGSGRWAKFVAPRVDRLNLIEPSDAIEVAKRNVAYPNCHFFRASADDIPLPDESQDFGYCLGVLHHIPDPEAALRNAVAKLRPGAPFLLYVYYRLDGRPALYRALWRLSNAVRLIVCRLPHGAKFVISFGMATLVYYPLARLARGPSWPLHYYSNKSFYSMRTDAFDRFSTRLELRFSRAEVRAMMERAGLVGIRFSPGAPFWVAAGFRSASGISRPSA